MPTFPFNHFPFFRCLFPLPFNASAAAVCGKKSSYDLAPSLWQMPIYRRAAHCDQPSLYDSAKLYHVSLRAAAFKSTTPCYCHDGTVVTRLLATGCDAEPFFAADAPKTRHHVRLGLQLRRGAQAFGGFLLGPTCHTQSLLNCCIATPRFDFITLPQLLSKRLEYLLLG